MLFWAKMTLNMPVAPDLSWLSFVVPDLGWLPSVVPDLGWLSFVVPDLGWLSFVVPGLFAHQLCLVQTDKSILLRCSS